MKIAKNVTKYLKRLKDEIKIHRGRCVEICNYVIIMLKIIFVENILIANLGILDSWITWIKEILNLLFIGMIWLTICSAFDVHPISVIKKKCRSVERMKFLGFMAIPEIIFSIFEGFELGRIFLLITFIIIFVQLWRDKKGKNDKDNKYKEVTRNLKKFGPPAIEIKVVFIVRFFEIVVEILTTCCVGSLLKPNVFSIFLYILTVFLYLQIGVQIVLNFQSYKKKYSYGKQQTKALFYSIGGVVAAFLTSARAIQYELDKAKPANTYVKELGHVTAIQLFFSFLLVLITWFCYFSYCGWLLKRKDKSLDYEFWTLLFKSTIEACIAFAVIENELQGTDGVGIDFTIWLSIINSLVTTLYPMIDMYKFARESLKTTPSK